MKINKYEKNKIIVIVGTTASGKTGLAVRLAYKFGGEIISADSRQVYRGMDIGTGKDLGEYWVDSKKTNSAGDTGLSRGCAARNDRVMIPYHLIDIVSPKTEFNLGKWLKAARKAVDDILARGKVPIVAGGTGLYAQALADGFNLSPVKADKKLRARLEKMSVKSLFARLRKLDRKFADGLHESDKKNKRRLIRYIEIRVRNTKHETRNRGALNDYKFLIIGLTWPREELRQRIYKRLVERLEKEDMIGEVERLHKQGVSWKRLEGFGLEYKHVSLYLRGKLDYDDMVGQLYLAICQFARRQMSWLRRWERQGVKTSWVKNNKEAEKLARRYLKK